MAEELRAKTVAEQAPTRHRKHIVIRDGKVFTATPCYGMHAPWWVVAIMDDVSQWAEAEPVVMQDSDVWLPLTAELLNRLVDNG